MCATPNYMWNIPTVTGDLNIWGTKLNTIFGQQDSLVRMLENCNIGNSPPSTLQNGTLWLDTSGVNPQVLKIYDGTTWAIIGNLSTSAHTFTAANTTASSIGDYKVSMQTADHNSWLICDGRALSRTTYAGLYNVQGTPGSTTWPWGQGDGITTFNLPDGRGLVLAGEGLNANPAFSPPLSTRTIGQYLGEENHILTVAELAAHTHTTTVAGTPARATNDPGGSVAGGSALGGVTGSTGSSAGHNTMQPTMIGGFIFIYSGV